MARLYSSGVSRWVLLLGLGSALTTTGCGVESKYRAVAGYPNVRTVETEYVTVAGGEMGSMGPGEERIVTGTRTVYEMLDPRTGYYWPAEPVLVDGKVTRYRFTPESLQRIGAAVAAAAPAAVVAPAAAPGAATAAPAAAGPGAPGGGTGGGGGGGGGDGGGGGGGEGGGEGG